RRSPPLWAFLFLPRKKERNQSGGDRRTPKRHTPERHPPRNAPSICLDPVCRTSLRYPSIVGPVAYALGSPGPTERFAVRSQREERRAGPNGAGERIPAMVNYF